MAKPDREAIATFVSITGASESVAVQLLEAHGGDLYQAVDAYVNKGVGNSTRVDTDDDIDTNETVPVGKLSALRIDDVSDYDNDIEEEMVRAAIEASKREAGKDFPDQLFGDEDDSRASFTQLGKSHVEEPDLAHAVSLSLKTAEQEKTLRVLGGSSTTEASKSTETGDKKSPTLVSQRWIAKQQAWNLDWEATEKAREEERTRRRNEEYEEMARQLKAKEASLPPEPKMGDENVVSILVTMPSGSRRKRRFLKSDKLQYLFYFIDLSRSVVPGTYKLVNSCSPDILSLEQSNLSLEEVGLTGKKEFLFLEKISNVGFKYGNTDDIGFMLAS